MSDEIKQIPAEAAKIVTYALILFLFFISAMAVYIHFYEGLPIQTSWFTIPVKGDHKQILSGTLPPIYSESLWLLNQDNGDKNDRNKRSFQKHVSFSPHFACRPAVIASMNFIDATPGVESPSNVRISVYPDPTTVTTEGFDLLYETWGDSKVWGVGVNWIAIENKCSSSPPK